MYTTAPLGRKKQQHTHNKTKKINCKKQNKKLQFSGALEHMKASGCLQLVQGTTLLADTKSKLVSN